MRVVISLVTCAETFRDFSGNFPDSIPHLACERKRGSRGGLLTMVALAGAEPATFPASRDALSIGLAIENLVDLAGVEPATSSMPLKRAPNCATGPHHTTGLFLAPLHIAVKPGCSVGRNSVSARRRNSGG